MRTRPSERSSKWIDMVREALTMEHKTKYEEHLMKLLETVESFLKRKTSIGELRQTAKQIRDAIEKLKKE